MQKSRFMIIAGLAMILSIAPLSVGCSKTPASPEPPATRPLATPDASHKTNAADLRPERVMVDLASIPNMTTLIGFNRTTPYPWPRGNWASYHFPLTNAPAQIETWAYWQVINIYSENLNEITRRLGTKTVEMLILPITNYQTTVQETGRPERSVVQQHAYALVSDARIPRDWLLYKLNGDPGKSRQIKAAFPECFRAKE